MGRWFAALFLLAQSPMPRPTVYKDLEAWKLGMDLVVRCYRSTASFPNSELYGLTSQLRRAAVSIPTNVAEGRCRKTDRAYANHVSIVLGSHGELETCIEIAFRLGFPSENGKNALLPLCDSVGRLLNRLYRSIEARIANAEAYGRPPR